jgi:pimeloyl-ACP methyl ester carboxylesterase
MARIILLPGLGANERMFENIDRSGLPLLTPSHLIPGKDEGLPAFARRTAEELGVGSNDIIGGSSFGGVVAAAIARQMPVRALVLLGGALDASGLRPIPGQKLIQKLPSALILPLLHSEKAMQYLFAPEGPEVCRLAREMLKEIPDEQILRGGRMLLAYHCSAPLHAPVFALHGALDPIMLPPPVENCRVLPKAGHAIPWTHGAEASELLRQIWSRFQHPG